MNRDDDLKQRVTEELEWEPRVDAAHIGIACRDGVCTLSGHVGSYDEKSAAERAVQRVRGVKAIAVELDVRLSSDKKTADDEIAARAVKILDWDGVVPRGNVHVKVENGVVTLAGTVAWQYQKTEAETDVRKLSGVTGVVNLIAVKPAVEPSDLRSRIRRALERNADLDASAITVEVAAGKVTITGTVSAWAEREIAERAAWSAPGVTEVVNRVAIGHR